MKHKRISEIAVNKRINEHYNNAKKISLSDLKDCEQYFYEDLPNINVKGYPFASAYENINTQETIDYRKLKHLSKEKKDQYKLKFFYLPPYHEIYIGSTGSGKTTCGVEPQIRALANQKNKPNLFITDPKGELFAHHAKYLKDRGYNVKIINFKDTTKSEKWSPFYEIAMLKQAQMDLKTAKAQTIKKALPKDLSKYDVYSNLKSFDKNEYYKYKNTLFATMQDFETYKTSQLLYYDLTISQKLNEIVFQIVPDGVSSKDRTWADGSRNAYCGAAKVILESFEKRGKVDADKLTIRSVYDLLDQLTLTLYDEDSRSGRGIDDIPFLRGYSDEAKGLLKTVFDASPITRKSFIATIASTKSSFLHPHITQITSGNTIDESLFDTNFAIFFTTRDTTKADFVIASLFINWIYSEMMTRADEVEKQNGVSSIRTTHFILDEFANIPKIPDFETKIAVSRSRNIYVHLFLQSYAQIESVYDDGNLKLSETIFDNCNAHIYMGCQNINSVKRFSEQCGKTSLKKDNISGSQQDSVDAGIIHDVPVLPESALDSLEFGQFYIKRLKQPVILSQHVPSYIAKENGDYPDFSNIPDYSIYEFSKESLIPFNDPRYQITKKYLDIKNINEEENEKFLNYFENFNMEKQENEKKSDYQKFIEQERAKHELRMQVIKEISYPMPQQSSDDDDEDYDIDEIFSNDENETDDWCDPPPGYETETGAEDPEDSLKFIKEQRKLLDERLLRLQRESKPKAESADPQADEEDEDEDTIGLFNDEGIKKLAARYNRYSTPKTEFLEDDSEEMIEKLQEAFGKFSKKELKNLIKIILSAPQTYMLKKELLNYYVKHHCDK